MSPADAPAGDAADKVESKKNGAAAAAVSFAALVASVTLAVALLL
jgi:hypothetical protein